MTPKREIAARTPQSQFRYRAAGYEGARPSLTPPVISIIHPDDVDGMQKAFQRPVRREADRYHYEFRIRHKSGEWRRLLGRGLFVERAADGTPLRMVGTDSDITQRKQVEEALGRTHDDLDKRVRDALDREKSVRCGG